MTGSRGKAVKFWFVQALTFGRIPLILVFLGITVAVDTREAPMWFGFAFMAMVAAALTDLFDGYFARKFDVVSRLGAYADPLTDKIFYLTVFPALVYCAARQEGDSTAHAKLLLVLAVLFLLRDQWVTFLRSIGALHGIDAKANWSGKLRTLISFPVVCVVYYHLQAPDFGIWRFVPLRDWTGFVYGAELASLAVNLVSIWVYTRVYWPALKKEIEGG